MGRKRWTAEDAGALWRHYREGAESKELAVLLGRSRSAVCEALAGGIRGLGIGSLRERRAKIIQQAEQIADIDEAHVLARGGEVLDGLFGLSATKYAQAVRIDAVTPTARDVASLARERREHMRDLRELRGEPSRRVEVTVVAGNSAERVRALARISDEDRRLLTRIAAQHPELLGEKS